MKCVIWKRKHLIEKAIDESVFYHHQIHFYDIKNEKSLHSNRNISNFSNRNNDQSNSINLKINQISSRNDSDNKTKNSINKSNFSNFRFNLSNLERSRSINISHFHLMKLRFELFQYLQSLTFWKHQKVTTALYLI